MENKRISDLPALTTLPSTALFPVVDVSDTSQAKTGTDKKITASDLFNSDQIHLLKIGGAMQGILNMGGFGITNLLDPINAQDAATKNYIDTHGHGTWGSIGGTLSSQTDLQTALNAKEPTISASTIAKYWRGDKTFQTLNTDVVPEGSNLYYTDARVQVNRLDQLAQPTSTLHMNSQLVSNLANPLSNQDAATKSYVDSVASGLNVKGSVIAATTTILANYTFSANTLTANANGAFGSIDGVSISLNDRILVKNETGGNAKYNGIYTLTQVGDGSNPWILTRATDADTSAEMPTGVYCFVTSGTIGAATGWVLTSPNPITLNTTSLTFTQFVGALTFTASGGIILAGSVFSLDTSYSPTFAGLTLTSPLTVGNGGTGQTTFTNGQLLIGNTTGNTLTKATLTAGNSVTVTNGTGSITLDTIQDIRTSASPTFSNLNLSASSNQLVLQSGGVTGTLTWTPATSNKTITLPNVTGTVITTGDTGTVTNTMLAGSIAASKLIGTDIATVGTITTGIWTGTTIAVANGGTGATSASGARINLGAVNIAGDTMTGLLQFSGTGHAGVQLNSLTTTQRNALTAANGMVLNNSTLSQFQKYENSQWVDISKSPATKVIAFSGSGYAADYYVTGTADSATMQAAINSISSGIIDFMEGTYDIDTKLVGKSNITLRGRGWNTIFRLGNNVNDTVLESLTSNTVNFHILDIAIDMNASNNTTINSKHGINLSNSSNTSVERVKVSNMRHAQAQTNVAIGMANMTNSSIKNCYVFSVGDYGIATNGLLYCQIEDNFIQNPAGHGISMEASSGAFTRSIGCSISRNTVLFDANETLDTQDGIKLAQMDYCTFNNNKVICINKNGAAGIHSVSADTNYENGNTFSDNTISGFRFGIQAEGSLSDSITGNTIAVPNLTTLGPAGIQLSISGGTPATNSLGVQVTGNTITYDSNSTLNAGGAGIYVLTGSSYINIVGNTILNASYTGVSIDSSCDHINISGNIIKDSMTASIYLGRSGTAGVTFSNITGNTLSGASRNGNGSYSDIELHGACTNNKIMGNTIYTPNANVVKYGIDEVDSTCDSNRISDNFIQSTATTGTNVHIQGANSVLIDYKNGGSGFYGLSSSNGGGAIFILNALGSTNPKKFLRSRGGSFEIIDSAFTNRLFVVTDAGNIGTYNISSPATRLDIGGGITNAGGIHVLQLSTPSAPTITNQGTAGSTTYGYKITAASEFGETLASTETQTTTGNATLNGTNFNQITWTTVTRAVKYNIYRTTAGGTPSTTGLIGTVLSGVTLSLNDTGLSASGSLPVTNITANVGINQSSPTALLHLGAGVATVGGAQLKFTSGVLLTTPEDGAVNYDGSHLYFTIGSTRYQLDQQGGGTVTSVSGTTNRITSTGGATPVIDISASYVGQSSITTLGTISTGVWNGTTIAIANGGTGQTTASAAFNALSPMTTLGDIIYGGASGTNTRLAGNTTSTRNFLRQTGTGTVSAAPVWDTVTKTDVGLSNVENTALSTWAGSANITTLGTITTGVWTGTTIAVANGGTGATTATAAATNLGLGTGSAPTFAGLSLTGPETITSVSASSLAIGPNGTTNPVLKVDSSFASQRNGVLIKGDDGTIGAQISVISSHADESLQISAQGGGLIILNSNAQFNQAPQTVIAGAANTSFDGFILYNSGAATSGNQRYSPRLTLTGFGWKTTATAASQQVDWIVENQPVQGAANPSANLVISNQINAGGYAVHSTLKSSGAFDLATGGVFSINGTTVLSNNTLGSGVVSSSLTSVGTITTGVWAGTAIDHTHLTGITQSDVAGLLTSSSPTFAGLNLGTGVLNTVGNIEIDGTAARDITVGRATSGSGVLEVIQAGGAQSTASNTNGGELRLSGGISTGNGSSFISFYGATLNQGSASTDRTPTELMRLTDSANGTLIIGATTAGGGIGTNQGLNLGGSVARSIHMVDNTGNNAGNNLGVKAGSAASSGATDKAGGDLILASGRSTGTAIGKVRIQAPNSAVSTGTSQNTLIDRIIVSGQKILTNNSAIAIVDIALATLAMTGGAIIWTVESTDGTDMTVVSGITIYSAENKGGVYVTSIVDPSNLTADDTHAAKSVSSGATITATWTIVTGTNKITLTLNANSSKTGTGYPRVTYTLINNSPAVPTIL